MQAWQRLQHSAPFPMRLAFWPGCAKLSRIIRIDRHIVFGEIARPETASTGSNSQVDTDQELGMADITMGCLFVELRRAATIPANLVVAKPDIHLSRIDRDTRIANGCKNAPPVRIIPRPGRFHQR